MSKMSNFKSYVGNLNFNQITGGNADEEEEKKGLCFSFHFMWVY